MGTYRAVKVVYRKQFEHQRPYEREFNGIQKFEPISRTHEGMVDILQVGRNDREAYFYYVMELADDLRCGQNIAPGSYEPKTLGETISVREALPFRESLELGLALSSAIGHLHKRGLIHRDIKPSNIIFVNGIPKLADIGLVTDVGTPSIPGGTLGYIAPEGIPSPQADIYSLGKVLYEISTGKDRQEFPDLPDHWGEGSDHGRLLELNEVILKACDGNLRVRYQSAEALYADLVLLEAGKSVKRLRTLERRLALFTKVGAVALVLMVLVAGAYYQAYREQKIKTQQLAESYVAYGTRSMDEGDWLGSLSWFAGALRLDEDSERARSCRVRIATALRQCPRIVQMCFQDGRLNYCEFSPDGQRLITAGINEVVTIWNAQSGKSEGRLEGHTKEVEGASFSRDGRFIITCSVDKTARVWEAATGKEILLLPHSNTVYSARFNSAGDRIVTACKDDRARMFRDDRARVWKWNGVAAELLTESPQHKDHILYASFSSDGRRLVTASRDQTAQVWDIEKEQLLARLQHPPAKSYANWVFKASFSPDGRFIVTASFDNAARIWDVATAQAVRVLNHEAPVRSAEFSPDGRYVVTAGDDFFVKVWDVATGKIACPPLKHNSYIKHAAFSPEGRRIATASTHGIACLWDLAADASATHSAPVLLSRDGNRLVTIRSNVVTVERIVPDEPPGSAGTPRPAAFSTLITSNLVREVRLSSDGSRLLTISDQAPTSSATQITQLWDTRDGRLLASPVITTNRIACVSDDGRRLVTLSGSNAVIWDTSKSQPLLPPLTHRSRVNKAALDPNATRLLTSSGTNAYVWDLKSGNVVLLPHPSQVSHVEFSPDGRRLVTSCMGFDLTEREAQVWDTVTGTKIGAALKHADGVEHASFRPDGARVVTAGRDRAAVVWETETGKQITPRLNHEHIVSEASFSPDGRWVVTVCDDDTARVWDAETGLPITPPLKHSWPLRHARFVAGVDRLLTRRYKEELWMPEDLRPVPWMLWELSPDNRPLEDLVRFSQLLSGHQRQFELPRFQNDQGGGALPLSKEALRERWDTLHTKYPDDFKTSPDQILSWHQRQGEESEAAKQWSALLFHLDRLLELQPNNPSLMQRRARARQELDKLDLQPKR